MSSVHHRHTLAPNARVRNCARRNGLSAQAGGVRFRSRKGRDVMEELQSFGAGPLRGLTAEPRFSSSLLVCLRVVLTQPVHLAIVTWLCASRRILARFSAGKNRRSPSLITEIAPRPHLGEPRPRATTSELS